MPFGRRSFRKPIPLRDAVDRLCAGAGRRLADGQDDSNACAVGPLPAAPARRIAIRPTFGTRVFMLPSVAGVVPFNQATYGSRASRPQRGKPVQGNDMGRDETAVLDRTVCNAVTGVRNCACEEASTQCRRNDCHCFSRHTSLLPIESGNRKMYATGTRPGTICIAVLSASESQPVIPCARLVVSLAAAAVALRPDTAIFPERRQTVGAQGGVAKDRTDCRP
jgi:hypothetical protein